LSKLCHFQIPDQEVALTPFKSDSKSFITTVAKFKPFISGMAYFIALVDLIGRARAWRNPMQAFQFHLAAARQQLMSASTRQRYGMVAGDITDAKTGLDEAELAALRISGLSASTSEATTGLIRSDLLVNRLEDAVSRIERQFGSALDRPEFTRLFDDLRAAFKKFNQANSHSSDSSTIKPDSTVQTGDRRQPAASGATT
jgi:hypothetical protein